MGRMIIDAATSIDGFCADERGKPVFPVEEMHWSGMFGPVFEMCGAVIMSRSTFEIGGGPDWFAQKGGLRGPVFVVTEDPPRRRPRKNSRLEFHFIRTFADALYQAEQAAGDKPVLAIGGAGTVQAALLSGAVDEMWLRIAERPTGGGTPLFGPGKPGNEFFVSAMEATPGAVFMKLRRR